MLYPREFSRASPYIGSGPSSRPTPGQRGEPGLFCWRPPGLGRALFSEGSSINFGQQKEYILTGEDRFG